MVWWGHSALPQLGQGSAFAHLGLLLVPEQRLGEAPAADVGSALPNSSGLCLLAQAALRPSVCMWFSWVIPRNKQMAGVEPALDRF